jgi:hypothetical protein
MLMFMLKLLAFVLPLGLDSFAVAAAIGAVGVAGWWQKLRISLILVLFAGGMPLIGLGLGSALARGIGHVASCLAAAAVIGIGAWLLVADEEEKADRVISTRGWPSSRSGSASAWTSWPSGSASAWPGSCLVTKEPATRDISRPGTPGRRAHRKLSRIGTRNTRHLDPGYPYGGCRALGPNDIGGPS